MSPGTNCDDMSGNIHILKGYVCMITALNSIDN